jgi:hypothetical protein
LLHFARNDELDRCVFIDCLFVKALKMSDHGCLASAGGADAGAGAGPVWPF